MDDIKVKSKWMPGGEGSQVLVCAIQFRPPTVVELLSNSVSAAHAVGKQLQTSIMKISTHQLHVSVSRQITLMPLGSTVLGFCPKRKALFKYCVLIDPLWALDDSNFSAHTSISVSDLPPIDQSCSWYILATKCHYFSNITWCVIHQLCLWCPSLKTSFQFRKSSLLIFPFWFVVEAEELIYKILSH